MLRIGLNPNPGPKVGWALEGEEIKKISTVSTAWNPFHKLASLSSEHLPSKLAEAEHLFVGEITNVYLDRGKQPLTAAKPHFQGCMKLMHRQWDVHSPQN